MPSGTWFFSGGKWVHQGHYWDNIFGYHGECPSWHGRLRDLGHEVAATGKLHFRSTEDDNRFSEEIDTLHMIDGVGHLVGSIRNPPPPPGMGMPLLAAGTGPGDCTYNEYDTRVADHAIEWINRQAKDGPQKPWVLMTSFVRPHYPLTVPPEFFNLYDPKKIELPEYYRNGRPPRHPWIEELAETINYGDYFRDEDHIREGIASYYALVSFVDHQIGRVLDALETARLVDNTRIIYSSDHGDNVGDRGLWGKSTMYEESAAIPMIMAGPDIPMQKAVKTPVSLVDIYATAIECLGYELNEADKALPSRSLFGFLKQEDPERTIISEYHAMGSRHASFMLRCKDWKYIYYVNKEPELFNLAYDPDESHNLADDPDQAELLRQFEAMLRSYCDPEAVDKLAHSEQRKRLDELGGVEKILADGAPLYSPVPGEKSSDQIEAQEQLRQS